MTKNERLLQVLIGLGLVIISVLSCILLKDGTAALFLMPLGLFVIFTKEKAINFSEVNRHE